MTWLYTFLFAFILYADVLDFIPMINYWDEALTIIIILFHFLKMNQRIVSRLKKEKLKCYVAIILIIGIGLSGNFFHSGIQSYSEAIWKDIVAFLKFPLLMTMMIGGRDTYYKKHHLPIMKKVCILSRGTIVIATVLAVIGYFINIGVYTDEVRYIKCYQYVYTHPTYLVVNIVFCISMLLMEGKKKNKWFIYTACVLLFFSQRFKAYAIIAIIILLMTIPDKQIVKIFSFDWKTKIKTKYIIPAITLIGTIVYFVFRNRFATYLSWGMTSARLALIVTCARIACDFFPVGSGFGTFASFLSGRFYSGIYSMYGLTGVSGLKIDQYNYISDTFWPWVIGQFGFIGGLIYIRLIYKIFKNQFVEIKDYEKLLAFLVLWIYAILASMMEAFFTNTTGVAMAVILVFFVGTGVKHEKNETM